MSGIDWLILAVYFGGLFWMCVRLARGQKNTRDYFVAGRSMPAWAVALSTAATQCSANTLLGAPAFVAFAAGGGLVWLQFELVLPIAAIVLMLGFFPTFRALRLVTLYEYLEMRFGLKTRVLIGLSFQLLRAFATGVTLYSASQILILTIGVPFWTAVLMIGAITVIYDVLGGIKADIWTDVVQMILVYTAIIAALFLAVHLVGGPGEVLRLVDPARLKVLDFQSMGIHDKSDAYGFWPILIGGFFLYLAYYGCDQTQAQRVFTTKDMSGARKALFYDGLIRFPFGVVYCLFGLALAAYAIKHADFLQSPMMYENGKINYNRAVPAFVMQHFPPGLVGFVVAGLCAAAMSSLNSTFNSLSAVTMLDFVKRFSNQELSGKMEVRISRIVTAGWGALCITFSFFVGDIAPTVVEAINKISSLINGPILAVFALGLFFRRAGQNAALAGFGVGLAINLTLWLAFPNISWLWWNAAGCLGGITIGVILGMLRPASPNAEFTWQRHQAINGQALRFCGTLAGYAILIFAAFAVVTWLVR